MARITIKDIARESGVSTATVSRVLNNTGYASNEIREKVMEIADKLNYQPNAIARSLKMKKTNTIGVIVPDIGNPYFMQISKGIEDIVQQDGYNLIFGSGDESPKKESEILKVLLEKRVDAIVLATSGNNTESIKRVINADVPVVLIDRKAEDEDLDFDSVFEDNFQGAYQLTEYLIKNKHEDIGVINGSLSVSTGSERYAGYQQALKDNGLKLNEDLVYNGNFLVEDGKKAVNHFFNRLNTPTAILSFNNTMTFGVVVQLTKLGVKIPKEIVVASYGQTEIGQLLSPPGIVYIKQSPYKMGTSAGELVLDRLRNRSKKATHRVFKTELGFENKASSTEK